jgi:hypothetical protein
MQTAVWRELLSMVLHPLPKSGVDLQKNMTLKERLERYLRNNHGWIASGDLQRLVMEKTSYTPQNVGCRLRELAEEGKLEVMYVRNHAHYRSAQKPAQLESATLPRESGGTVIRPELR